MKKDGEYTLYGEQEDDYLLLGEESEQVESSKARECKTIEAKNPSVWQAWGWQNLDCIRFS